MGQKDEAMTMAKDARGRLGDRTKPASRRCPAARDLGVAYDRISDMRLAAGDTLGALEESLTGMEVVVALHRDEPSEPQWRRSLMVAHAKTANLRAMTGDRAGAARDYQRSRTWRSMRARFPTTPTRPGPGRGVRHTRDVLAEAGEIDSARSSSMSDPWRSRRAPAAADPDDVLQQIDLAKGQFEMGRSS
jgi:hypothetical protein